MVAAIAYGTYIAFAVIDIMYKATGFTVRQYLQRFVKIQFSRNSNVDKALGQVVK